MATPAFAASAAAIGFYFYVRQRVAANGAGGLLEAPLPIETHTHTEQAPTTWAETLYLFKEAVRYMYQETLGRWHAVDLFFGLAYISQRSTAADEYPASDIAAAGHPVSDGGQLGVAGSVALLEELTAIRRYMLLCQGLRHHKPELQRKHWKDMVGLDVSDIIAHSPQAGLLRPAYVIVYDRATRSIILCIRGTHSRQDMFTSLTGAVKPHHVVCSNGVVLGYSHLGMLAAARWMLNQVQPVLKKAMAQHPDYQLRIVGHSMGGGTAAMLTMMMREKVSEFSNARCWAIACPACMTLELAKACAEYVTTVVHGTDIVPTFSSGSVDALRDEVSRSSWFAEFQRDMRTRVLGALQVPVRGFGSATQWTARNILAPVGQPFRTCYGTRTGALRGGRQRKRAIGSTDGLQRASNDMASTDGSGEYDALLAAESGAQHSSAMPSDVDMERALEQALRAVEAAEAADGVTGAAAPRGSAGASSSSQGTEGSAGSLGAGAVAQVPRHLLGTKRPAAPGKKDDDAGASGSALQRDAERALSGAEASSSSAVSVSTTLRRRAWAWQTSSGGSGSAAMAGTGRSMVQYLGQTVNQTGKLVAQTSSMLRTGMFTACRVQPQQLSMGNGSSHPNVADQGSEAAAEAPVQQTASAGPATAVTHGPAAAAAGAAVTAAGAATNSRSSVLVDEAHDQHMDGSDSDSDSDPDLNCGFDRDRRRDDGDLESPTVRAGITAVVAALAADGASDSVFEEESAAESMLQEAGELDGHARQQQAARQGRRRGRDGGGGTGSAGSSPERRPGAGGRLVEPSGTTDAAAGGRQGSGGERDGSGSPSPVRDGAQRHSERHKRRQMFPAGRILHLMPSAVVARAHAAAATAAAEAVGGDAAGGHAGDMDVDGVGTNSVAAEHELAVHQQPTNEPSSSNPAVTAIAGGPSPAKATAASNSKAAGQQPPYGVAQEPYTLLEVPANEVYGRVRLCRTMVMDHFIPAYLRAVDSVMQQLEEVAEGPDQQPVSHTAAMSD